MKLSFFHDARRYLAVVAGVISEADYVFIPESPPPVDWEAKLCTKLEQASISSVLGKGECDPRFSLCRIFYFFTVYTLADHQSFFNIHNLLHFCYLIAL